MAGHCRVPSHQSIPSLFFNITQYWLYQCKLRIVPVNFAVVCLDRSGIGPMLAASGRCRVGSGILRHIYRVVLISYVMWSCSDAMFSSFVQLHLFLLQQSAEIKTSMKPASVICHTAQWHTVLVHQRHRLVGLYQLSDAYMYQWNEPLLA